MGTWGIGISSNDTFADVYGDFFDLYNEGLDAKDATEKVIAKNQEIINDEFCSDEFWFALGKAQWESKALDENVFNRVKQIIESGSNIRIWQQQDASKNDIKKRKVVLDKFLLKLQTEKAKPKSRKKNVTIPPAFEKGDCLTFKFENGNYGGAIVLESINNEYVGHNFIVSTRINQQIKPTIKDFEKAEVLFLNFANWDNQQNMYWYSPFYFNEIKNQIEKIGNIQIEVKYEPNRQNWSVMANFKKWFIEVPQKQFEFEKDGNNPQVKEKIKKLIKKKRWFF